MARNISDFFHNLLHFAGCIVAVTRRRESNVKTIVEYRLVKLPQAPERESGLVIFTLPRVETVKSRETT